MPESTSPPAPRAGSSALNPLRQWVNPRRMRFWAIVLLLLYTLGGFFAVPVLVEKLVTDAVRDDLDRSASIARVRFNPYVLSLEVSGFDLKDKDAVSLAAFDRLFVNFQLSSLFRWAWTFREISLDGAVVQLERFAPGDSRLTRLMADAAARSEPEAAAEPAPAGLPRLLVHDLALNGGRVTFRDDVPSNPVELALGPVTVSMQELNTLPDRFGRQTVEIRLPGDATLSWQGSISLGPLQSEGRLALENSPLDQTIAYLEAILPLDAMRARLSLRTDYRVNELDDGSIDLELDGIEAELEDLAVTGLTPSAEFFLLPSLTVRGGTLRYPEQQLTIASIELANPELNAWLEQNGELSLLGLVPAGSPPAADSGAADAAPESQDWQLAIDTFRIAGGRLGFTDESIEPQATLALENLELDVTGLSNEQDAAFPVELAGALAAGGDFRFNGRVIALPELSVTGSLGARGIPLPIAQPYVQQQVRIQLDQGTLDTDFELALLPDGKLTAAGELAVHGLGISDTVEGKPLVGWDTLNVDRFEADSAVPSLALSKVEFQQPFARVVINKDLSTNLDGLMVTAEGATDEPMETAGEEPGLALVVGGILLEDGTLDFSDLSLPLPFATRVQKLGGLISTIDTASVEPATLRLEGQVDDYGLARIEGTMNPLDPISHTDISLEFRNLLMSNLSPYTVQFAGREIASGKLDLDLLYRIEAGQLQGANDIVMSDLVLGDKVDHPDAASLPLGLAVALLKDANGVIDIDLPVEGDVNSPEFQIGGVIWKAFTGLITKIVSAPFRLLGNLIGVEAEDLGQFEFLAGRHDLTPPEMEKIAQLQQALEQRPELSIAIAGVFDPAIDIPALRYQRLLAAVRERLGADYAPQEGEFRMLDEEIRAVLEAIYVERFPDATLEALKSDHMVPPPDDPEGEPVVDGLAYAADLRDRLLAAEEITRQDLDALANARAEAIRGAFLATERLDAGRVVLEEPAETESEDGEWVVIELAVAVE